MNLEELPIENNFHCTTTCCLCNIVHCELKTFQWKVIFIANHSQAAWIVVDAYYFNRFGKNQPFEFCISCEAVSLLRDSRFSYIGVYILTCRNQNFQINENRWTFQPQFQTKKTEIYPWQKVDILTDPRAIQICWKNRIP